MFNQNLSKTQKNIEQILNESVNIYNLLSTINLDKNCDKPQRILIDRHKSLKIWKICKSVKSRTLFLVVICPLRYVFLPENPYTCILDIHGSLRIVEIQIVYKQSISRNNAKKIHKNENRTALLVLLLFENNRT